jgi:hypothetical protein
MVREDYPYVEVDFRGSADLVLHKGSQWDVSGKTRKIMTLQQCFFVIYIHICIFCLYNEGSKKFVFIMQIEVCHV